MLMLAILIQGGDTLPADEGTIRDSLRDDGYSIQIQPTGTYTSSGLSIKGSSVNQLFVSIRLIRTMIGQNLPYGVFRRLDSSFRSLNMIDRMMQFC